MAGSCAGRVTSAGGGRARAATTNAASRPYELRHPPRPHLGPSRLAAFGDAFPQTKRTPQAATAARESRRPYSSPIHYPRNLPTPRPKIDLDPHEGDIRAWVADGLTAEELRGLLGTLRGVHVGLSTLCRWTSSKGIQMRRSSLENTPTLRETIYEAFHACLTDERALQILRDKGYDIGEMTLKHQRRKMGLAKKIPMSKRDAADAETLQVIEPEMGEGHIADVGRSQLYAHMRTRYNFVERDRIHKTMRERFPDAIEQRRSDIMARIRGPRSQPRQPQPPPSPPDSADQAAVTHFRNTDVGALDGHEFADARLLQAWQDHVDQFIDPNLRS